MTPEQVLDHRALVLDRRARQRYFDDVLLHCRVVHGSAANYSSRMRPLLLNVYAAADALPMTPAPTPTSRTGLLVRGREPAHVHMEPYPARLPPRWDQVGYGSIFSAQAAPARPAP